MGKLAFGPTEFLCEINLCFNVTQAREYGAQPTNASLLQSTCYAAVLIGEVGGILCVSSLGGTIGGENLHSGLPSFSTTQ